MQQGSPQSHSQRVAELDLSVDLFQDVLARAVADVRTCTDFDAPGMRGTMFWSRANRYLAEELQPKEWAHTSRDSILRMLHPTRSHAITAISGHGGIGDLDAKVRSKNPKGAAMARLVEKNGQLAIFTSDEVLYGKQLEDIPTWCLLYKRDKDSGSVVAELSLPVKMNGKFINEWRERIPLLLPDLGDPGAEISLLDDPLDLIDPDVHVEYREDAE